MTENSHHHHSNNDNNINNNSNSAKSCSLSQAQSAQTIIKRDYLPSPSPPDSINNKNDTPSTDNTLINMPSNSTPTPNRTPNPIPTVLPNMTFQPLLTSMNPNIVHNKENNQQNNSNIPRIVLLPNFSDLNRVSLPPLPLNDKTHQKNIQNTRNGDNLNHSQHSNPNHNASNKGRRGRRNRSHNQQTQETALQITESDNNLAIKMEVDTQHTVITRSRSRAAALAKSQQIEHRLSASLPPLQSIESQHSESYAVNQSAIDHNLKVKQEHLKEEPIVDTIFDECYIFSMRCPYSDCCQLFNDMASYQAHHINVHQQRDKNGKLISSKEAKWTCPECNKVSASWYNYAAHVTMHKDSCDAPWICKLPPINKKKYVEWTDGSFICGKRCSTKHNLIKHLRALHVNHRIIDLCTSVKAQSSSRSASIASPSAIIEQEYSSNNHLEQNPKRTKKRPRFTINTDTTSSHDDGIVNVIQHHFSKNNTNNLPTPTNIAEPPRKRMKVDPDSNATGSTLSVFPTGDNIMANWNDNAPITPCTSAKEQGNFINLLLEAAELIEKEELDQHTDSKSSKSATSRHKTLPNLPPLSIPTDPPSSGVFSECNTPNTIPNINELLSSIKTIFNSSAHSLAQPMSLDNLNQLSAVLAITAAATGCHLPTLSTTASIFDRFNHDNKSNQDQGNRTGINGSSSSESSLQSLLRLLNGATNHHNIKSNNSLPLQLMSQIAPNIMVNNNTFNTFNNVSSSSTNSMPLPIPLMPNLNGVNGKNKGTLSFPTLPTPSNLSINPLKLKSTTKGKEEKNDDNEDQDNNSCNNSVISANILSALPRIMISDDSTSATLR